MHIMFNVSQFIVKANYQIAPSKAVVGVDRPVYALSLLSISSQIHRQKVSEYGQEIPQAHTTDQPMAS